MTSISRGLRFTSVILQWGPVPPSGGPLRERFLDQHGRQALQTFADEYDSVLEILGEGAEQIPALDFGLIEADDVARRAIQREKRQEWDQIKGTIGSVVLDAVKPHIEKATDSAVAALNYLEDHTLMEDAHSAIHKAAFVRRGISGCPIVFRDDDYWSACPINLSHLRMGLSAGLTSDFACSICNVLVEDCDHQMGERYPKLATRDGDQCSICDATECDHIAGESYFVEAYGRAKNAVAHEVSFVRRPRYPQARIIESTADLGEMGNDPRVRKAAERGLLQCDVDLGPCKGFNHMEGWETGFARKRDLSDELKG